MTCAHAATCPCGGEVVVTVSYTPVAGYPDSWTGPGEGPSVDDVSAPQVTCEECGAILTAQECGLDLVALAEQDMRSPRWVRA